MNQFSKQVQNRQHLYNEYTKIINGLLGLTSKQILVLSKLFELSESTPSTLRLLNKDNRKEIIDCCAIDECNLSTYLTLFKSKGLLNKIGDKWIISKEYTPVVVDNGLKVVFTITI